MENLRRLAFCIYLVVLSTYIVALHGVTEHSYLSAATLLLVLLTIIPAINLAFGKDDAEKTDEQKRSDE